MNSPLPTSPAIGAYIAALRVNKGWSRRQLARLAGLTLPALDRLEKGTVDRVDLYKLEKIAESLDVSMVELIGLKGHSDVRSEVALNLLHMQSENELNGVVRALRRGLTQMEPAVSGVSINLFRQGDMGCYFSTGVESGYFSNPISSPDVLELESHIQNTEVFERFAAGIDFNKVAGLSTYNPRILIDVPFSAHLKGSIGIGLETEPREPEVLRQTLRDLTELVETGIRRFTAASSSGSVQEALQRLLAHVGSIVSLMDDRRIVQIINKDHLLDYVGQSVDAMIHPDYLAAYKRAFNRALVTRDTQRIELQHYSGEWMNIALSPFSQGGGRDAVMSIAEVQTDESRELEQAYQKLNHQIDLFVALDRIGSVHQPGLDFNQIVHNLSRELMEIFEVDNLVLAVAESAPPMMRVVKCLQRVNKAVMTDAKSAGLIGRSCPMTLQEDFAIGRVANTGVPVYISPAEIRRDFFLGGEQQRDFAYLDDYHTFIPLSVVDQVQAVFYTHGSEQAMENLKESLTRADKAYPVLNRAAEVVQRLLYTRQLETQIGQAQQELVLQRLTMSLLLFITESNLPVRALFEEVAIKFMEHGLFRSVVWSDVDQAAGYAQTWYVRTNTRYDRDGVLYEMPNNISPQPSTGDILGKRESLAEENSDNLAATAVQTGRLVALQGHFQPDNSSFALPLKNRRGEVVAVFITGHSTTLWISVSQTIKTLQPVWDALGDRLDAEREK